MSLIGPNAAQKHVCRLISPPQKAVHSQPAASEEVKHIRSAAHLSFYYHKCQQSLHLSPFLQWRKCQKHLQQAEHWRGPGAPQPVAALTTAIPPPAFCVVLRINVKAIFMQYFWDFHPEFKAQESVQLGGAVSPMADWWPRDSMLVSDWLAAAW